MTDYKSTILLKKETRILLSKLGRKNQTYDQIIRELIEAKNKISLLENENGNLCSSKLKNL